MSAAHEVFRHLEAIGATIEHAGDSLLLRAGPKPIPAAIIRRVREAKPELLVLLQQKAAPLASEQRFARVIDANGEPGLEQPWRWYCGEHRPGDRRF